MLDHLFGIVLVLALLTVAMAVGRAVVERFDFKFAHAVEVLLFSIAVGLAVLATALLILGLLGLMDPAVIGALFLIALALTLRRARDTLSLVTMAGRYVKQNSGGRPLGLCLAVVVGAVSLFLLVMAVAPPVDWDSLMYHVRVPAQFLDEGRIFLPEDNFHTAFVNLGQLLYVPLLAAGSLSGPAALSSAIALLLCLAVFSLAARFLDAKTASLSGILLWGSTTILLVAITPKIDVVLLLYLLLAHYALLAAVDASEWRRAFYLSAAMLGLAFGVKYHALLYAAALIPLIAYVAIRRAGGLPQAARAAALYGLVFLAAAFPWLLKNAVLFGAPLHPLLSDLALEPWLAALAGSTTVPANVDPAIFETFARVQPPFNLIDAFFHPGRTTFEYEGAFQYANRAFLLLPLALLYWKNRMIWRLIAPAILYVALLFVALPLVSHRYLLPAAAPLTLAIAYLASDLTARGAIRRIRPFLLVLLAIAALAPTWRVMRVWLTRTDALSHLVGRTSRKEYIATHLDPSIRALAPVIEFANTELPEQSKILMVFESRGLYFEPAVIQDGRVANWPLLAAILEPDRCLESRITHVLFSTGAISYYARLGVPPDALGWEAFRAFAERCLTPIYRGTSFVLLAVDPQSPER
jgi:hypothetical protein